MSSTDIYELHMISTNYLLALSQNLGAPDFLILMLTLAFTVIPFVGFAFLIYFLIRFFIKRKTQTPEQRLQQLNAMLAGKSITETEYQTQRQRILTEI
jgi:hypothetical protein